MANQKARTLKVQPSKVMIIIAIIVIVAFVIKAFGEVVNSLLPDGARMSGGAMDKVKSLAGDIVFFGMALLVLYVGILLLPVIKIVAIVIIVIAAVALIGIGVKWLRSLWGGNDKYGEKLNEGSD